MSHDIRRRTERNDASRNAAENFQERWDEKEIEQLCEMWEGHQGPEDLVAIAELLGRTVEACRQKYYNVTKQRGVVPPETRKNIKTLSNWAKGYTSLEDMGF